MLVNQYPVRSQFQRQGECLRFAVIHPLSKLLDSREIGRRPNLKLSAITDREGAHSKPLVVKLSGNRRRNQNTSVHASDQINPSDCLERADW